MIRRHPLGIVLVIFALGFVLGLVLGCSPSKVVRREYTVEELYSSACRSGREVHSVTGNASLKVSSPQVKGRFPALIRASSSSQLAVDVMNPFGGTEASIRIDGNHYTVKRPGKKVNHEGMDTWSGIPLHWISDLFLGKIPCPSGETLDEIHDLKVKQESGDQLTLLIAAKDSQDPQEFHFHFQDRNGKPWPDSLQWIRGSSSSQAIEFKFEDPEKATSSPLKWEAKSNLGSIQVRWRERNINTGT